jgi:hypothetical protein
MRLRHIVMGPARLYILFPYYLINGTVFVESYGTIKCVWIFSTTFVCSPSHSQKKWARNVKCPLFFSDFNETRIFLDILSKNTQISNFMKIRPVSELFLADGRTGRQTNRNTDRLDEANSHFSQFCQRARTGKIYRVTKLVAILICCSWFIGFVYLNFELQILALVEMSWNESV